MSYFDTTNISNYDELNFKKVRCKKCGAEAVANTRIILTSDPPMYNVTAVTNLLYLFHP